MKKLLSILSIMLIITVVKAQQTTGAINQAPATITTNTTTGNDKQCHGVTKDCPIPCTAASEKKCKDKSQTCTAHADGANASSNSATESMSAEHVSSGSAVISTTNSDDKCKGMKGKSCCKGMSKASALNTVPQVQPANEPAQEAAPKQ